MRRKLAGGKGMKDPGDKREELEPEELELRLIELLIELMGMDQEEFEWLLAELREEEGEEEEESGEPD